MPNGLAGFCFGGLFIPGGITPRDPMKNSSEVSSARPKVMAGGETNGPDPDSDSWTSPMTGQ